MTPDTLPPCPFCGRDSGFQVKSVWGTWRFVACECKAAGPVMRDDELAMKAWATRPSRSCTMRRDGDAWVCSDCGKRWKSKVEGERLLPLPAWMRRCAECGAVVAGYEQIGEGS